MQLPTRWSVIILYNCIILLKNVFLKTYLRRTVLSVITIVKLYHYIYYAANDTELTIRISESKLTIVSTNYNNGNAMFIIL